jgi:methylated-DNA-protein-cysteine methyltransferase-like protein
MFERVSEAVKTIPVGKVCTYGQVALMAGSPGAARQVGWSLASLPQGTDVPWHRVINAKGQISLRGRLDAADFQKELLQSEGVVFDEKETVDLELFRYFPEVG